MSSDYRVLDEFPLERLRPAAAGLFDELRAMSFDGVGITRECFGPLETAAHAARIGEWFRANYRKAEAIAKKPIP